MASQPFKRAFLAQVKERGGWSPIYERIASGETLASVARDYGCSRSWLSRVLNEDDQRKALLQIAKREGAAAHVEEALRIVDDVPAERDEIAKARLQVEHRRWMAGVYDREQFGERPATVDASVSFNAFHLDALRTPPHVLEAMRGDREPNSGLLDALGLRHRDATSEVKRALPPPDADETPTPQDDGYGVPGYGTQPYGE